MANPMPFDPPVTMATIRGYRIFHRMSIVAIIGAGTLGGTLARALAARSRVDEVRLIDPEGRVAEGKALDIQQSSPVDQWNTRVTASTSIMAAAGASVVAFADLVKMGDVAGEAGLAVVRQIARADTTAPLLFAGGTQRDLMALALRELRLAPRRLIGSAPFALESSIRAVAAALLDASPADLSIGIAGVPPRDVAIGWDAATAFNQPISAVLAPHHLAAIAARVPALWPPAPYTLGSAAARIAEALANGSRRRYTCFAVVDGRLVAAVPVEIEKGGIKHTLDPALSRHERTIYENGLR
jgi:malate dehydrogenase